MDKFVSYLHKNFMNLVYIMFAIVCWVLNQILCIYSLMRSVIDFLFGIICCERLLKWLERLELKWARVAFTFFTKASGVTTEEYDQFDIGEDQETEAEEK